jgi:hypothetical protein
MFHQRSTKDDTDYLLLMLQQPLGTRCHPTSQKTVLPASIKKEILMEIKGVTKNVLESFAE